MRYQFFKPTTPSKRVFSVVKFFNNVNYLKNLRGKIFKKKNFLNKLSQSTLKGYKSKKLFPAFNYCCLFLKKIPFISTKLIFNKKLFKETNILKSIFQHTSFYPSLMTLTFGISFLNFISEAELTNENKIINSFLPLKTIPFLNKICFIFNSINSKYTYALSTGTVAVKVKAKKKEKLIKIKLPSGIYKFISKETFCINGQLVNYKLNKLKKGKYGAYWKKLFSLKVRGVAMNPVDHPNGGRTKSKSPEKSPWGWIAKHNC